MATTTTSPNMNLPVPVPSEDPGPDWAQNEYSCFMGIDSHNHSSGQGRQITPDGISISSDLAYGNNNLITVRSTRFTAQAAPLALSSDVGCIYESGVDLYYNDGIGNQVRITQGGSVAGAAGTITGLPSGTASASFAAGTFTFQAATLTPATMAVGPLIIGRQAASSKTVTLAPNVSQASNYSVTFPAALPAATNFMTLDASGNIGFDNNGFSGTGAVVLQTSPTITTPTISSPTITGTISGSPTITTPTITTPTITTPTITTPTISGATFTGNTIGTGILPLGTVIATLPDLPGAYSTLASTAADVNGFVVCAGQTIIDVTSPMNGAVIPNINSSRFLIGTFGTSGVSGGAASVTLSAANLAAHTHGAGSYVTSVGVTGGTASLTGTTTFGTALHNHVFSHVHQWAYTEPSPATVYGLRTASVSNISINTGSDTFSNSVAAVSSGSDSVMKGQFGTHDWYTTGAILSDSGSGVNASTAPPSATASVGISSTAASMTGSNSVTGTSGSTGSGTSFSILPSYITCLYIMRIK